MINHGDDAHAVRRHEPATSMQGVTTEIRDSCRDVIHRDLMYGAAMNDIVQQVKITISGGKISYEDDISLSQAAHIIAFLDSSSGAANATTAGIVKPAAFAPPPPKLINAITASAVTNPREALESSGAKTNPEKIVAFALYIGQEGAKDTFTLDDIKPLFRRTRETVPGNITRDLAAAIRAGWVADSDAKDEYYVTSKAAQVLETGFESLRESRGSGTKGRASAAKSSRKTAKSPKAIPDAFLALTQSCQRSTAISTTISLRRRLTNFCGL